MKLYQWLNYLIRQLMLIGKRFCADICGKEFLIQVSGIAQDGKGKIGEKKAKEIIYDKLLEHLSVLCKKRSEDAGIDNIKYISTYNANSISELTNDKVQEIVDDFSKQNS
ncbi:3502_t:CDS:2 [Acaulospora colombiana]|uniref:3502_t:CDS:1 n=1 Tax=Acaulospora colombiana TaxID=27376 RepID=A0ACA9L1L1_9GLOM|nr:3502_t:CDS:2 [Acaulospora colombiana]